MLKSGQLVKGHALFFLFIFLFYTGMYCSKIIHPLWFSYAKSLPIFGYSYALMAFVGMFSFFYGSFTQKLGPYKSIVIGCILYSLGIFLRIIPNSYLIASISSILAGIGASTVLICLRYWIASIKNDSNKVSVISAKNIALNIGCSVGAIIAGFLLIFSHRMGLIVASILPLVGILVVSNKKVHFLNKSEVVAKKSPLINCLEAFKRDKALVIGLVVFSSTCGLTCSFIVPYLPVIYAKIGVKESFIGYIIALCTIIAGIIQISFKKYISSCNKRKVFVITEICLALATFIISLKVDLWLFIGMIVIRTLIASVVVLLQEMVELELIGKSNITVFFGVIQSSFLFGDMLGGSLAGFAYASGNINTIIAIASILILCNGVFLPIFSHWREVKISEIQSVSS